MIKKIVIIGAGGFGREVASIIEVVNSKKSTYDIVGFLDDNPKYCEGDIINGYPWLGKHDWILQHKDDVVCTCAIGNPKVKQQIQNELTQKGVRFQTVVAYGSYIGPFTEIGEGCVIYGGITISANCKIGDGVLLNESVNIGHDVIIGDYTVVSPMTGISGNCIVGSQVRIGGHAFIVPGRKIGDTATIAAGSIVFSNVKSGTTVLGNPAKRMREIE